MIQLRTRRRPVPGSAQAGQSLVELAISVPVLLIFALGIIAVGQVVREYMAVRQAASQAALAAARAPSAATARQAAQVTALDAIQGSQVGRFQLQVDVGDFRRGGVATATATGYVSFANIPLIPQFLGRQVPLSWTAHTLIEPFRSRAP
jgi:Flp pilus assembly protein TadG